MACSRNSFDDLDNDRHENAGDNHRCNRKIKTEVLFFNSDIAWQAPDPIEFVREKINYYSYDNDNYARYNNIFSNLGVHHLIRQK